MFMQGRDCSIVVKTSHVEKDIPYSEETIREAVSLLKEEAAIEGDGACRAIRKGGGVTGCVVTPLTIGTAPLLLYLAMGDVGNPAFVSGTRNLYQYHLGLLPTEDTDSFDLIQDRGIERRYYEGCRVEGFEMRFERDKTVKLKIDVCGERPPVAYVYFDTTQSQTSKMPGTVIGRERFKGDCVKYRINGNEYKNIYGITLSSKKQGGTKTELWIRRAMERGADIPEVIDEIVIEAQLMRDVYEYHRFGLFRITVKRLVLVSNETAIECDDTVIGPLRFYVSGVVSAEVFASTGESIT